MSISPLSERFLDSLKGATAADDDNAGLDLVSKGTDGSSKGSDQNASKSTFEDLVSSNSLFFKSEEKEVDSSVSPFAQIKRKVSSGLESLRGKAHSAIRKVSSESKRRRRVEDVSVERYMWKDKLDLKIDPALASELKEEQIALLKSEEERLTEELQLITNIWSDMKKTHLNTVKEEEARKAKMFQEFETWKNTEKSKLVQLEAKQRELEKEMKFRTEKIALLKSRLLSDKKKRETAQLSILDVSKQLSKLQEECRREEKNYSQKMSQFLENVEKRRAEALASINKYKAEKNKLQASMEQRMILRRALQPQTPQEKP